MLPATNIILLKVLSISNKYYKKVLYEKSIFCIFAAEKVLLWKLYL